MGCTCRVVGALEEHQIAGAQVGGGYPRTDAQQPGRTQPPEAPAHAAIVVDVADEAGAVEGGGGCAAAPDVGVAEILLRLLDDGGELRVLQRLRGYLVLLIVGGVVFPDVLRAAEQVRAVAQSSHIHGVKGELILRHDIDRHMGEVEVFQLYGADVVGVRHLHGVFIALQVSVRVGVVAGSGFRAVSRFRGDGFR